MKFLFFCLFFVGSLATSGMDVSVPVTQDEFTCIGLDFVIVRCWHSYGAFDDNCPGTVAAAWAAGYEHVDIYMFPCFKCGDAAGQVSSLASSLSSNGVQFGMLWLDIEGPDYWGDVSDNQQFFSDLASAASSNWNIGVYTSESQWVPIFGQDFSAGSSYPLWYAHYDDNPSFDDFNSFGGWTNPAIKQYSDSGDSCGIGYDENWYP